MKRLISFFVLVAVCISAFATSRDFKVMTYNLRYGELASMEEFGKYILSENPDVVALQECDWSTHRDNALSQNGVKFINVLAEETGMFGLYGKAIDFSGGYYGVGILSKYPIVFSERVLLPNVGDNEQRVMLVADIELPDGEILTFVCTHLEAYSSECRVQQAKFIDKKLARKKLCLLAGDMNADPDALEIKLFDKNWVDLTNDEFTFSTIEPSVKLDYIYAKKSMDVELKSTVVDHSVKMSDHFPVISMISINY